jgi:PadR family transcriptional regulator PadR
MGDPVRMTTPVVKVVSALLADPDDDRYGLELMRDTGLASGTLYPVLVRLEAAGWVASHWEAIDPVVEGRPPRRYYRLTPSGVESARAELAALRRHLSRATAALGRVAPA